MSNTTDEQESAPLDGQPDGDGEGGTESTTTIRVNDPPRDAADDIESRRSAAKDPPKLGKRAYAILQAASVRVELRSSAGQKEEDELARAESYLRPYHVFFMFLDFLGFCHAILIFINAGIQQSDRVKRNEDYLNACELRYNWASAIVELLAVIFPRMWNAYTLRKKNNRKIWARGEEFVSFIAPIHFMFYTGHPNEEYGTIWQALPLLLEGFSGVLTLLFLQLTDKYCGDSSFGVGFLALFGSWWSGAAIALSTIFLSVASSDSNAEGYWFLFSFSTFMFAFDGASHIVQGNLSEWSIAGGACCIADALGSAVQCFIGYQIERNTADILSTIDDCYNKEKPVHKRMYGLPLLPFSDRRLKRAKNERDKQNGTNGTQRMTQEGDPES